MNGSMLLSVSTWSSAEDLFGELFTVKAFEAWVTVLE